MVGGFASFSYWSSTEDDDRRAWLQSFVDGTQGTNVKYGGDYVRAIRAF